jgi:hypothetical protein
MKEARFLRFLSAYPGNEMMKITAFLIGLLVALSAAVVTAQTEPSVVPAGTETVVKPHKKAVKKHTHKVSAKKHKSGKHKSAKHKKPSVS